MTAYFDTGAFFDYMIYTSHAGPVVRTAPRRNGDVNELFADARECFEKVARAHRAYTSCHTLFEVEGAVFSALKARPRGIPHAGQPLILSARPVILQSIQIADRFGIEIKDVTKDVLSTAASDPVFSTGGVRLGDTLHMTTAMAEVADLIVSGDDPILSFDRKLRNASGAAIRCLDTHEAKLIR